MGATGILSLEVGHGQLLGLRVLYVQSRIADVYSASSDERGHPKSLVQTCIVLTDSTEPTEV